VRTGGVVQAVSGFFRAKGILVNAGIANAAREKEGFKRAGEMARMAEKL
jgi:N-acetylglutamate synthase/N-acetylornithine aminotransferase